MFEEHFPHVLVASGQAEGLTEVGAQPEAGFDDVLVERLWIEPMPTATVLLTLVPTDAVVNLGRFDHDDVTVVGAWSAGLPCDRWSTAAWSVRRECCGRSEGWARSPKRVTQHLRRQTIGLRQRVRISLKHDLRGMALALRCGHHIDPRREHH